jgi:hypothetical protein
MFEWMPILWGFCFGVLSVLISKGRMYRLSVCCGILLIAATAVFLSGEWRSNLMYFALDLIEAFGAFAAGAVGIVRILHAASSLSRKRTASQ